MKIIFNPAKMHYEEGTFHVSEVDTPGFATEYTILNPQTGGEKTFHLSHSTGSEWDPKTVWIYKTKGAPALELRVSQNPEITRMREKAYLKAKLG